MPKFKTDAQYMQRALERKEGEGEGEQRKKDSGI